MKKPGPSLTTITVLPIVRPASTTVAPAVSSEVPGWRMTSSSGILATGLKKCMPTTLSGRRLAAASLAMGIAEVLEAKIRLSRRHGLGLAEHRALDLQVLEDRLDHEVGAAAGAVVVGGAEDAPDGGLGTRPR